MIDASSKAELEAELEQCLEDLEVTRSFARINALRARIEELRVLLSQ